MNKVFVSHIRNVHPVMFGQHELRVSGDKQIEHYIDGRLVATVPPEGWQAYGEEYPEFKAFAVALLNPSKKV